MIARNADWLLREVLCRHQDQERFHAYEKHHDTVKEACESAAELGVKQVVLWHTEDKTDIRVRKDLYQEEGKKWLDSYGDAPVLYVPDDGDVIAL